MLEKRLAIYPDAITVKRVVDIIGYSEKTIRWHINKGRIFTILQDRKYLVSKFSLIKFLARSTKASQCNLNRSGTRKRYGGL